MIGGNISATTRLATISALAAGRKSGNGVGMKSWVVWKRTAAVGNVITIAVGRTATPRSRLVSGMENIRIALLIIR